MKHDPDPEFLDHLEWQTERALRRRDRFARPVSTGAPRIVRTLLLVLLCTMSGAGLVIGAERIQQSREAELLLEQNRIQLALADSQLDRAVRRAAERTARYENGLIGQSTVIRAEQEVLTTERHRIRLTLEREEILGSDRAPNLEITAPRVGGRDFGTEYLQLERDVLSGGLAGAQMALELSEARYASGIISSASRERDLREVRRHELELQRVQGRIVLRAEYLSGRLEARATLRRDQLAAAGLRQKVAAMEIEILGRELERTRILVETGRVSSEELSVLEGELAEFQASLALAVLELQLLKEQE